MHYIIINFIIMMQRYNDYKYNKIAHVSHFLYHIHGIWFKNSIKPNYFHLLRQDSVIHLVLFF